MDQGEETEENHEINEKIKNFPIPRSMKTKNKVEPIKVEYKYKPEEFDPDLFQLFFGLVNFHLPAYGLEQTQQFSMALKTVGTAFEQSESNLLQLHIARQFLLECHNQLLALTSNPKISKISVLHNELFLASEFFHLQMKLGKLIDYCDMLMAETCDMFISVMTKIANDYWKSGKTAEKLISEVLKKEMEKIRILNNGSFEILSKWAVKCSIGSAPPNDKQKILYWAKENEIKYE